MQDGPPPMEPPMTMTPPPKVQLAVIFSIKLAVIITNTQAMPYINELLAHQTGRPKQEIGYYVGLLSLATWIPQVLGAYPWGWASGKLLSCILVIRLGLGLATLIV
jgi:hypothetical protein